MDRSREQMSFVMRWVVAPTLAGLALVSCSRGSGSEQDPSLRPMVPGACQESPTPSVEGVKFTFYDRGGGSPVIKVYCGPGETSTDKIETGTYYDGDSEDVICKVPDGRSVSSDLSVGESPYESRLWFLITGQIGVNEFATENYGYIVPQEDIVRIRDCTAADLPG